MLKIDPTHHLAVQQAAVAAGPAIQQAANEAVALGLRNVFFASAGGVALLAHPAAQLLQQRSSLTTFNQRAAELVAQGNSNLGPQSLVVFCSVSGTTPEAVEALELAQKNGARVLTFTGTPDTPMANLADVNIPTPAADDTSSETYLIQTLLLSLALMQARGEYDHFEATLEQLALLPLALIAAKEQFEPRAAQLAPALLSHAGPLMFTSAGNTWPEAWYYAMCILEEMQWRWTRPVHASDFFHGPLELIEPGVPVVLLKGEDNSRALAERLERFVPKVGGSLYIIDSASFALDGISPAVRALVAPAVLATVLERLSAHIESLTGHLLTTRRYYKQMDY
ncbi:MAG: SIS domain-containing protein [Micrococcales bacterium]|nr:SIS domain-containing protein [Micrococcales bacterium]